MLPSKFRFGISVIALTLALSMGDAHAAQVTIADGETATGRSLSDGDDLRYTDNTGNVEPLDFTFDDNLTLISIQTVPKL